MTPINTKTRNCRLLMDFKDKIKIYEQFCIQKFGQVRTNVNNKLLFIKAFYFFFLKGIGRSRPNNFNALLGKGDTRI